MPKICKLIVTSLLLWLAKIMSTNPGKAEFSNQKSVTMQVKTLSFPTQAAG